MQFIIILCLILISLILFVLSGLSVKLHLPIAQNFAVILDSLGGKVITTVFALLVFKIVSRWCLPDLKLKDIILRKGIWSDISIEIQKVLVFGWFIILAVIIYSFAVGGIG